MPPFVVNFRVLYKPLSEITARIAWCNLIHICPNGLPTFSYFHSTESVRFRLNLIDFFTNLESKPCTSSFSCLVDHGERSPQASVTTAPIPFRSISFYQSNSFICRSDQTKPMSEVGLMEQFHQLLFWSCRDLFHYMLIKFALALGLIRETQTFQYMLTCCSLEWVYEVAYKLLVIIWT